MSRFIAILSLLIAAGCSPDTASDYPNILIIVTDDQGYGDVGYHGNDVLETPVLDQFAARSIHFDRFYVSPVCAPTRASLLTGKYHLSTGVSWVTHRQEVMRQGEMTIAEYLKQKGYVSGLFGKWHNGSQFPHDPLGQGFDTFVGFKEGHFNNYFNPVLTSGLKKAAFEGYLPDIITDEVIKFMSAADQPFFGMVAYNTPHSPFQVPDDYFDKYKMKGLDDRLAAIYGMIENVDTNVGRLMDELQSTGQLQNTLLFFVGDNGPNGTRFNGGLKGIKSHVDEGGVRVPALLSFPNLGWNTGMSVDEMAAHIDVFPTIAGLFGDTLDLDGIDLSATIQGKPVKRTFFTHQVVRKLDRYPGAVREGDFLLTIKDSTHRLFNIAQDPGQQVNLSDSLPQKSVALRTAYEEWIDQALQDLGEPELIETGHTLIDQVEFQAQEVTQFDQVDFKGKEGWSNDYFINFSDSSYIEWQTKTVNEATYAFSMELQAEKGTEIRLYVDSNPRSVTIDEPRTKVFVQSPDRVERGEVYEYSWMLQELGVITLKPGLHTLGIRVSNSRNLEIKSLQLTKTDEQSTGTS